MVPFNFRRASRNRPQVPRPPLEPMIWDDDTPRKLLSEDNYTLVATMPRLMDDRGTVCSPLLTILPRRLMTRSLGAYHEECP
jgi:hypothetical protein